MSNDLEDGKDEIENVEIGIEKEELQNNTKEIEQQELSNLKDKNEAETSLASGNFLSNGSNDTMDTAEGEILIINCHVSRINALSLHLCNSHDEFYWRNYHLLSLFFLEIDIMIKY
jgi:hypothetical protein